MIRTEILLPLSLTKNKSGLPSLLKSSAVIFIGSRPGVIPYWFATEKAPLPPLINKVTEASALVFSVAKSIRPSLLKSAEAMSFKPKIDPEPK